MMRFEIFVFHGAISVTQDIVRSEEDPSMKHKILPVLAAFKQRSFERT